MNPASTDAYARASLRLIRAPHDLTDDDVAAIGLVSPELATSARHACARARAALIEKSLETAPTPRPTAPDPAPSFSEDLGHVLGLAITTAMRPLVARVAAIEHGTATKDFDAKLAAAQATRDALERRIVNLETELAAVRTERDSARAELAKAAPRLRAV